MAAPATRTIPIRHCNFEAKVKVGGNGPPFLYLHPAGGPILDGPTRVPELGLSVQFDAGKVALDSTQPDERSATHKVEQGSETMGFRGCQGQHGR